MKNDSDLTVRRFTPLVRSIAQQIHSELHLLCHDDALIDPGLIGLREAVADYRPRQGLTQRDYLIFRIRKSIYLSLADSTSVSGEFRHKYLFRKKANEILMHYHLSAEGAVKRSVKAEQEELSYLLMLLASAAFLCDLAVSHRPLEISLDAAERELVEHHYFQDSEMQEVARKMALSEPAAWRLHFRTLEKIAARIRKK